MSRRAEGTQEKQDDKDREREDSEGKSKSAERERVEGMSSLVSVFLTAQETSRQI